MKFCLRYTFAALALILCCGISLKAQNAFDIKKANTSQNKSTANPQKMGQQLNNWKKIKSFSRSTNALSSSFNAKNVKPVSLSSYKKNEDLKIAYNENDVPYFILNSTDKVNKTALANTAQKQAAAQKFLFNNKDILKINNPKKELKLTYTNIDKKGLSHFKYKQYYKNIPVWASEVVLHVNANDVYCLNGRYYATPESGNEIPKLSIETALDIVKEDLDLSGIACFGKTSSLLEKLVPHCKPQAKQMWLPTNNQSFKLVWQIQYAPSVNQHWNYFVNAIDGTIEKKYQDVCSFGPETTNATDLYGVSRTINTYSINNRYYLIDASRPNYSNRSTLPDDPIGAIVTLDLGNNDVDQFGSWVDQLSQVESNNNNFQSRTAVSAHYNAGKSYEYFKNTFNRNSIDGKGGTIWSVINVAEDNSGSEFDNAFWNGTAMFYGNGKEAFKDLPKAIDAAAHEMSHGVIQNSANLIYEFQPGALNESFADVFGAMVDRDDWKIGEDVVRTSVFPSGAMRDMKNPNNGAGRLETGWQPANMSQYVNLSRDQDNGGVHINSGIPNRAFQLFATSVGKNIAEQVYYHALTNYLTQQSQFTDCRASVIQSSTDLYDNNVAAAAAKAFDDVGIVGDGVVGGTSGGTSTTSTELPNSSGVEHFWVCDVNSNVNAAQAFDYNRETQNFVELTSQNAFPKGSITDSGDFALYVGEDNNIYAVDLTMANPIENTQQLTTDNGWRKVAISRDGSIIAALEKTETNNLWIFDPNGNGREFDLYNPSTANDGTIAGAPEYADAIEFEPNGEYLMYDAYNVINRTNNNEVGNWDVGLIKVWDNNANDYGDGKILKLFPPQPSNISIGNATFAKNSSNIITFDMLDIDQGNDGELFVMAANLATGKSNLIHQTEGIIGYPTFSPDDNAIAFSDYNTFDNEYTVEIINLNNDKISASGNAQVIFRDAAWPVWYRRGARNWVIPQANFAANITQGPARLTVNFTDRSENLPNNWNWTFEGGQPASSTKQNVIVTYDNPGVYRVSLTVSNPAGNDTATKNNYITVGNSVGIVNQVLVNAINLHNQPNPFTQKTTIKFNMPNTSMAKLEILDVSGKNLQTVFDKTIPMGKQTIEFNAAGLAAGIYFMRLNTNDFMVTKKIIIR